MTPVLVKQLREVAGNSVCGAQCMNVCDTVISPSGDSSAYVDDDEDVEIAGSANESRPISVEYESQPTVQSFLREQQNDESLESCWENSKQEKGGFETRNDLLYHVEYVDCVDEKCVQLCLPETRRKAVLELAHCTLGLSLIHISEPTRPY